MSNGQRIETVQQYLLEFFDYCVLMNESKEKTGLHPKNKHKTSYDFDKLKKSYPNLASFVTKNKFNTETIDFSNSEAVIALNSALLKHFYKIDYWGLPKNYLCPPIPGRADYIHHVHDLINKSGPEIKMLDIGVGANCVYPLIANHEYGWSVTATDIDEVALGNAQKIIDENHLESKIKIIKQLDKNKFFENIIKPDDFFHLSVCNPPFHSSAEEARMGTEKKNRNLGLKKNNQNFGGQNNELWYEGGEVAFITKMIQESTQYKKNCKWFSTLVSKSTTLPLIYEELKKVNVMNLKTIDMAQGQKKSRIIAWTFTL